MKKQKGFTLIELLIYMGLLSTLLTVLSFMFLSVLDKQIESQANSAVEQDEQFILSRLMYDTANATSISNPTILGAQDVKLIIRINGVDNTYAIAPVNGVNSLTLTNAVGTNIPLNSFGTSISGLQFKRLGNVGGRNALLMQFVITSRAIEKSGPEVRNVSTIIGTR